jgi:hypothetical protein
MCFRCCKPGIPEFIDYSIDPDRRNLKCAADPVLIIEGRGVDLISTHLHEFDRMFTRFPVGQLRKNRSHERLIVQPSEP